MEPTKTLEETVEMMLSVDPDEQLKAEYFQAENRFITLNEMLAKWDVDKLDPVPVPPSRYVYGELLGNIRNYMQTLAKVAKAKGIDLSGKTETEESGDDNTAGAG